MRGVVRVAGFVHPGGVVLVVLPDAVIEVARQAADRLLVADVGGTQPAGREPAEMLRRLDQDDGLAHPLRLNRRDDAARRAAVHDDIERFRRGRRLVRKPRRHDEHDEYSKAWQPGRYSPLLSCP